MTRRSVLPAALVLIAGVVSAIFAAADPAAVINNLANRVLKCSARARPSAEVVWFQELFEQISTSLNSLFCPRTVLEEATLNSRGIRRCSRITSRSHSSQLAAYSGETLTDGQPASPEGRCRKRNRPDRRAAGQRSGT